MDLGLPSLEQFPRRPFAAGASTAGSLNAALAKAKMKYFGSTTGLDSCGEPAKTTPAPQGGAGVISQRVLLAQQSLFKGSLWKCWCCRWSCCLTRILGPVAAEADALPGTVADQKSTINL